MKLAQGMIGRVLIARLDEGEDLIDGIRKACAEVGIRSGLVVGLGELSEYRVAADGSVAEGRQASVLSLVGVVSTLEGQLHVHAHVTLRLPDGSVVGGHALNGNKVSPSVEVVVLEIQKAKLSRVVREGVEVLEPSE
ncbi:MAG: hypothetical protein DRJ56_01430 [Thermoprotei archaeon]|nr:MAG: hypothetical protein DRJ56_01430 [Thermoprotei archaeon]